MEYRVEHDSMGEVRVPADKYWGAQTERSHNNFPIGVGIETMPAEIIHAFGILKKAAARANRALRPEKMTEEKLAAIEQAADEVISGQLLDNFPLVVWQTGSGTQSNMNSNEVIANRGNEIAGRKLLHPNDDINMSQSSNDTFPTAMHIAAVCAIEDKVIPAIDTLTATFRRLEEENAGIVKSGRTHLQDATPISFPQEISGWRSSLERDKELLLLAVKPLKELALGGTAVGTGLNTPKGFDTTVAAEIAALTGKDFCTAQNKFHALTSKDELVYVGSNPYYYVQKLYNSIPYLIPPAAVLLEHIGRTFQDSLAIKGIPLNTIMVTSLLRTEDDVVRLQRHNGNATTQSCHRYGTTFDISYNKYLMVQDPDSAPVRPVRNDTLKWVLSEVLNDARKQGLCYVKYERKQGCYHITVR